MSGFCVNILNKTVQAVCNLENQVTDNTNDIAFIMKFLNFNKNLLLSMHGSNINIPVSVLQYSIDSSLCKNQLLKKFILGVLAHLNENHKENYYLLIESYADIPSNFRNLGIIVPGIIQISLVEGNQQELVSLLDTVRNGDLSKLNPITNLLTSNFMDSNSYTLAILQFLLKSPDVEFYKEAKVLLNGQNLSKSYDELVSCKKINDSKISSLFKKNIQIKSVLESANFYIKKGFESAMTEYKTKSFNDPYYPHPSSTDYINFAIKKFLNDHNLEIDNSGKIIDAYSGPFEPYQPYEPFEPNVPLQFFTSRLVDNNTHIDETQTQTNIELKIKQLLELTETSITNE